MEKIQGGGAGPDLIGYMHRQREGSIADLALLRRKNPQAVGTAWTKV